VRSAAPLRQLRLRLVAWNLLTIGVVLTLVVGGLFATISRQMNEELDDSLEAATEALERAVLSGTGQDPASALASARQLRIPERKLFLFDGAGAPLDDAPVPGWVRSAAREAATTGTADAHPSASGERNGEGEGEGESGERLHAERFTLANGTPLVAAVTAEGIELAERSSDLVTAFVGAGLLSLLLMSVGSWFLVRKSTEPIERSMEQMRRFMADAAHELRTPVAVLQSTAEVALQQQREPDAYIHALAGIGRESRRLGGLVGDLLTLTRADAGERRVTRERLFLDDVAVDAAASAGPLAEMRGVSLSVSRYEEAEMFGDPTLLRQLVMILLDNALKFTPKGGTVQLGIGKEGADALLTVMDSGPGIADEHLPHVFERFYRADPSRNRGDGEAGPSGAGLGLAIADWIARAHGGGIAVESEVGRGCTFVVRLPAGRGER
jgi:signal transduction histidine kinase